MNYRYGASLCLLCLVLHAGQAAAGDWVCIAGSTTPRSTDSCQTTKPVDCVGGPNGTPMACDTTQTCTQSESYSRRCVWYDKDGKKPDRPPPPPAPRLLGNYVFPAYPTEPGGLLSGGGGSGGGGETPPPPGGSRQYCSPGYDTMECNSNSQCTVSHHEGSCFTA